MHSQGYTYEKGREDIILEDIKGPQGEKTDKLKRKQKDVFEIWVFVMVLKCDLAWGQAGKIACVYIANKCVFLNSALN